MGRLLRSAPPGPVCIIGADIPGIRRAHVARAFDALGQHDAVLGPAHDGGFWLIGLRRTGRVPDGLFQGVRWSTSHALRDTINSLDGQRVALTDRLHDIDTEADLRALQSPRTRP
jgi:glycosyltransferase A (GT-A) superfamily protein (DUF2064 family)